MTKKPLGERPQLFKPTYDAQGKINSVQLPLFVTARDLVTDHPVVFGDTQGTDFDPEFGQKEDQRKRLMDQKFDESYDQGGRSGTVGPSIDAKGFNPKKPLNIMPPHRLQHEYKATGRVVNYDNPPQLADGHHRLSVMFRKHPDVPIPYDIGHTGMQLLKNTNEKITKPATPAAPAEEVAPEPPKADPNQPTLF
jgi:hypothetical protein